MMNKMKRLTALLLVLMMFLGTLAASAESYSAGSMSIDEWQQLVDQIYRDLYDVHEGSSGKTIDPPKDDPLPSNPSKPYQNSNGYYLTQGHVSMSKSDIVTLTSQVAGQWQVQVGTLWVSLAGQTGSTLNVTYAMLANTNSVNYAVRQVDADGNEIGMVTFDVIEATLAERPQVTALSTETRATSTYLSNWEANISTYAEGDVKSTYNIVINYIFEDETIVSDPYTANLAAGSPFSTTVTFPTVQGYLPYVNDVQQNSIDLDYTNVSENVTINVVYKPTNVNYTVIHYQQNVDNDNYTEVARETKQGLTGSIVGSEGAESKTEEAYRKNIQKTYEGFYALIFETPTIAADGSTLIEVYYDRYYYLMNFDMDGGYGTDPVYARYGAEIGTVKNPTKAGYRFEGWSETKGGTTAVTLPITMPAESKTYYAIWKEADTSYVIEYYLQDPDKTDQYDYVATSEQMDAVTGTTIKLTDEQKVIPAGSAFVDDNDGLLATRHFIKYEKSDENVVVKADGTTIVKVYYTRKEYTLRFYYAMSSGSENSKKYYVVGGSTYAFGASADSSVSDKFDELRLLDQYNTGNNDNRGQVNNEPTLKEDVAGKYSKGTETSTVNGTEYTYYYFTFSARYGADLSELWPVNVFDSVETTSNYNSSIWNSKTAVASAWNGEYAVYYSQHGSNQTIKGKYSVLDYQLLWDEGNTKVGKTSDVVSYLCFWENGANKTWSVPKLFVYNIWVSVLEGETYETVKEYDGITYYLRDTYDTVDNAENVNEQTTPEVNGFKPFTKTMTALKEYDTSKYQTAYTVDFYYTRESKWLSFYDGSLRVKLIGEEGSNGEQIGGVPFEASLSNYYFEPTLDTSKHEEGSLEFAGWYTSPIFSDETKVDFDTATMPSNAMVVYAKWIPVTHTVKFYLTENSKEVYTPKKVEGEENDPTEASFTVSHGGNIAEDYVKNYLEKSAMNEAKPNGDYTFVMWYYYDNGVKTPFDPTTQIRKDLTLYGEWSSNTLKQYTVQYVLQSDHSVKVADDLTGSGLAGTTKTFDAKGGTDLYAAYQEGYFPTVQSQSLLLDISSNSLVITFEYVPMPAVPYTVKYVEKDTGKSLADEKVVSDNHKAVVTETFKPISGYMPDAYQKRLVVTADGENVLYFYYSEDKTHAYYKITHYTQNTDGATWTEYASSQAVGDINTRYTASPMTIPGFTHKEIKYMVNGTEVKDVTTEGAALTADGLEINLYYVRNEYPYQVRYLEQGSGNVLHDPKNGTGKYGQVISESAIDIANYEKVDPTSQTLNIRIDEGEGAPKINIITFYYKEKEVTINYVAVGPENAENFGSVTPTTETVKVLSGKVNGSTPTPGDGFKFVGWFKDEDCTESVDASWVTDGKIVPQKTDGKNVAATYYAKFEWDITSLTIEKTGVDTAKDPNASFIFNVTGGDVDLTVVIKGNGSVTINGLKVGTEYTVTEVGGNWRYTPDETAKSITLVADATENKLTFTNNRGSDKWLDGDAYADNDFTK